MGSVARYSTSKWRFKVCLVQRRILIYCTNIYSLRWFEDIVNQQLLLQYEPDGVKTKYTYDTSCISVIVGKDNQKLFPDLVITPSSHEFNIPNCLASPKRLPAPPVQWWDQVRVIGELKANDKISNHADVILQVAGYVRQIFQSQYSRVFVHAFTLCGDLLRAWIFDRCGCLGSQLISINKEPELFLRVFCGYATMSAQDVGFDPTIRWIPRQVVPGPSPAENDGGSHGCDDSKGGSDDSGGTYGKHLWQIPYNPGEETVYDPTVAAAANAQCYPWLDEYSKHSDIWKTPPIPYPFIYITRIPDTTGSSPISDASNSNPNTSNSTPGARSSTPSASNSTPSVSDSIHTKMFLKPQAIFSSRAIVSRGTVIWAGRKTDTRTMLLRTSGGILIGYGRRSTYRQHGRQGLRM